MLGIGRAGRIRGAVEQQRLGVGTESRPELAVGQLETGLLARRQQLGPRTGQDHHVRITDPVGGGDQDLIARPEQGVEGVEQGVFAARVGGHLRQGIAEPVIPFQFGDNRLFDGCGSADRGVFGLTLLDGGHGRRLDMVGRVKVGLSGAKINHADALAAEGGDLGGDG